jgi:hypothetical protein
MTSTKSIGNLDLVASLLTATHYQVNHDMSHKLWNIVSTERYIFHMLGAAGMWLHINGNFTIGNLKSSLLNIEQRYITMKLYFFVKILFKSAQIFKLLI